MTFGSIIVVIVVAVCWLLLAVLTVVLLLAGSQHGRRGDKQVEAELQRMLQDER